MLTETSMRLRLARLNAGLEQRDLATAIGVHRNTVIATESGTSDPRFSVVIKWAAATDVSLDWIATGLGAVNDHSEVDTATHRIAPRGERRTGGDTPAGVGVSR